MLFSFIDNGPLLIPQPWDSIYERKLYEFTEKEIEFESLRNNLKLYYNKEIRDKLVCYYRFLFMTDC